MNLAQATRPSEDKNTLPTPPTRIEQRVFELDRMRTEPPIVGLAAMNARHQKDFCSIGKGDEGACTIAVGAKRRSARFRSHRARARGTSILGTLITGASMVRASSHLSCGRRETLCPQLVQGREPKNERAMTGAGSNPKSYSAVLREAHARLRNVSERAAQHENSP